MIAHISLGVTDISKSVIFYDRVMKAPGYDRLFGKEEEGFMAYGPEESFFIINTPLDNERKVQPCNGAHVCLKALEKNHVDRFYQEAMALGAEDAGSPGVRLHYADDYYAAYIYDPDGHKIEAVARVKIK